VRTATTSPETDAATTEPQKYVLGEEPIVIPIIEEHLEAHVVSEVTSEIVIKVETIEEEEEVSGDVRKERLVAEKHGEVVFVDEDNTIEEDPKNIE